MRKKISLLLSFILCLSMCWVNPHYIMAEDAQILKYLPRLGLRETQAGLRETEIARDAEEATMQWSIEAGGKYELEYYTDTIRDNLNKTTKVKLGFEIGKDKEDKAQPNRVKVTAELYDESSNPIEISAYQHLFPYTGQYSPVSKGTTYIAELSIPVANEAVPIAAKELSLQLGSNLKVRIKTDGKQLTVWTNQINQGYITDFKLLFNGVEQATAVAFPGLKPATISSIYLDGELKDRKKPIDASADPTTSDIRQAGDRPGVKVEIQRPYVREGNKFVPLNETQAEKIGVALSLRTKLEDNNTVSSNQIQLKFNLAAKEKLQGEIIGTSEKYAVIANNMIQIYIAKDDDYVNDPEDKKKVVEWPALQESMVLGGELTLNGEVDVPGINNSKQKFSISTGNVALQTGYTYLHFTPEQSDIGEVTLQITPYKYKGEIIYNVYVANATSSETGGAITDDALLGAYKYTYDPNYPDRKLEISIPSGVESIFLVKAQFSSDSNPASSQEVYYNSQASHIEIRPYTPQIQEINNLYVIPENNTGVEAAGMNVVWRAPKKDKLVETLKDGKKLYFEITLQDKEHTYKETIAIFKAELEDEKVVVEQVGHSHAKINYQEANDEFVAENVVLKDVEKDYWEVLNLPKDYESGVDYPTIDDSTYAKDKVYYIPSSYYLSMRAILDTPGGLKISANESQLYPITLDKTTELIPTPVEIKVKDEDTKENTNVQVSFKDSSLTSFVNYTLTPAKWYLLDANKNPVIQNKTFPGQYEIVLYQANYVDKEGKVQKNEMSDGVLTNYIKEGNEKIVKGVSQQTASSAIKIDFNTESEALKALRDGKVLYYEMNKEHIDGEEGIENTIDIQGLDPNQAYYIRARVKLESQRIKNGQVQNRETDYSLFSNIIGFTTKTVIKPVEPDEEVPPTPKDYTAEPKDNSTAVLNWKALELNTQDNKISYEIIRTTEQKLDEKWLDRNTKAQEIINQEKAKKATLFGEEHYKLIVDPNEMNNTDELMYELVDNSLQPNTMYYYYIRTVYNGIYSDWIFQPVTTPNIEAPISLKAFNATKTTVDFSFLAKVPKTALYNTYDFGIAIQSEDDPTWKTVLASSLSTISGDTTTTNTEGYVQHSYRLTGLTPGKRYNIKVCVIDKTKDKIDNKYQQSLYSNMVYIRTEYDKEQQDKEDKFEEYLDRFDKEVDKFSKQPYWVLVDGKSYKYREDYLLAALGATKEYQLVTGSNSNETNYYLPISVLSKMNEEQVSLKIALGDETVYIRPNTIQNNHKLLQAAQELVDANQLEDYYLNIRVKKSNVSGKINNEEIISPKITLDMNLIYMKQNDMLTEADMIEELTDIIKAKREIFIDRLEARLDTGNLSDDRLQSILDDVLADVEELHIQRAKRIIDKQTKKKISVTETSQAILIVHNGEHTSVNGYYYSNNWTKVNVLTVGFGFAIEAIQLGDYIFTGQEPFINTVPEIAPYQDFINKYQLTEFFVMDSYMLQTAVNKQQVYGALARMLGAAQGTDYVTYLQSKGIKGISKLTSQNTIRQDEAIYVIMQGYELIQNRKVNTVVIKNKQSVQNIGAFQSFYRPYIYAGVELKIVQPQDSRVLPSKQMTGTEIIAMLYKIQR